MKNIKELVTESLLLKESYGGEIARQIVTSADTSKSGYYSLFKMYSWDAIPDEAFERMDSAAAKKLAYKQSGPSAHIFWMERDKTIASSIGNFTFTLYGQYCRSYGRGGFRSVKAISEQADYAYVLKDAEKYETKTLRQQRRDAKAGATALMKASEVRDLNIARYEKEKAKMKLEKTADVATMMAKLDQITKEYTEAITELSSVGAGMTMERASSMTKLNSAYGNITEKLRSALSVLSDKDKEYTTASWMKYGTEKAQEMEKAISDLRTLIAKELARYSE